jgi:hypothetical protein
MKYLMILMMGLMVFFSGRQVHACSPPVGVLTHVFQSSDRSLASIGVNSGKTVLTRKTTNTGQFPPGMDCPNGYTVNLPVKSGSDAASQAFNEASKSCGRLFQLYLASTQKFRFEVTVDVSDPDAPAPACVLSLEAS